MVNCVILLNTVPHQLLCCFNFVLYISVGIEEWSDVMELFIYFLKIVVLVFNTYVAAMCVFVYVFQT